MNIMAILDNESKYILETMLHLENPTIREIATYTQIPVTCIHRRLKKLLENNIVKKNNHYQLVDKYKTIDLLAIFKNPQKETLMSFISKESLSDIVHIISDETISGAYGLELLYPRIVADQVYLYSADIESTRKRLFDFGCRESLQVGIGKVYILKDYPLVRLTRKKNSSIKKYTASDIIILLDNIALGGRHEQISREYIKENV